MCGVVGFWATKGLRDAQAVAAAMSERLVHRGPDDAGVWADERAGVALAHRRLSILDLSHAGHQPMTSRSGRFVIVFNGEIYNHLELRRELEKAEEVSGWRGHSDTETLLAVVESWGVERAVCGSVGMFAFALWDRETRTLTLARDRMGEKPLYYGFMNGAFVFGSELKALRAWPEFTAEIDRDALALFLRRSYVPSTHTIYRGIQKLAPGCLLSLTADDLRGGSLPAPRAYWSARAAVEAGLRDPFRGNDDEAVHQLEWLLKQSVAGQMVADVPLGAFLSGGVDSSTVVSLMQALSTRPVKTFTIGFHEEGYNEATHAKAVARHLGTDHTELYVTPQEARDVIPELPTIYDEPFSDASQIPTILVSRLTRQHVTVSLSGDGGDELFGGYNRYFLGRRLWKWLRVLPSGLRSVVARQLGSVGPRALEGVFRPFSTLVPRNLQIRRFGDGLQKVLDVAAAKSPDEMYLSLLSHWKEPTSVVIGAQEPATALSDRAQWPALADFTERMMFLDTLTFLPDDILVKVDRAAMGVSLETRVPLLDHRVVEFAWRLPLSMKIRCGQGKWLLRQVLHQYVPRGLVERPKSGFDVPIDTWLRGPLKEWAWSLIGPDRLRREGFLRPDPIMEKWHEHQAGQRNWSYLLWNVLMFQAWLDVTATDSSGSRVRVGC